MPLTDTEIKRAKHSREDGKPERMFDSGGMYLELFASGGKLWRLKYRFGGKEKRLALGAYPETSLKVAREKREEARRLIAEGIDPGLERKIQKAAKVERDSNSLEAVTREWFAKHLPRWSKSHADKVLARFENDIFPWLGGRAIDNITPPELLSVVRRIEARGALDTAHRALQTCGQVFRYAVATGRAERDPTQDLRGSLPPAVGGHFAAVVEPVEATAILRMIDDYHGTLPVRCALQLAPLVFVRPGELRKAQWKDIDLEAGKWCYYVSKTKTEHIVPLASQAVAILKELKPLTGLGRYVFPNARGKDERPMSDNAVLGAMRRMGIPKEEMTGHGFRAMARTMLHERLKFPPEYIEHQLAHRVPESHGTAYNRTKFLDDRKVMMQAWADYLDRLKAGADIISLQIPA